MIERDIKEKEARSLIFVTQKHIDEGEAETCDRCPVALALKEAGHDIEVMGAFIAMMTGDKVRSTRYWVSPPCEVYNFIMNFDSGLPVKPFSFRFSG